MKSIREMNCITYGDSGLNNALKEVWKTTSRPTIEEVDLFFQPFENWKSYLNFYLWRTLE